MKKRIRVGLAILAIITAGGGASAQSGGGYDLHWNIPGAGGGAMTGGGYSINGTIGQYLASTACANGYLLHSGFWAGQPATGADVIFRNGFESLC
jgi:hypothetical protein